MFIEGGNIDVSQADGGGVVSILKGRVRVVNPVGPSTFNIFGGTIERFALNPVSITNVYGFNLQLNGNTLSGLLADGSPINAEVFRPQGGAVNLYNIPGSPPPVPIPEPASAVLLGMALAGFTLLVHQKRR
jgi:hypothetical protein